MREILEEYGGAITAAIVCIMMVAIGATIFITPYRSNFINFYNTALSFVSSYF